MDTLIILFVFLASFTLLFYIFDKIIPAISSKYSSLKQKREEKIVADLEEHFIFWEKKKLVLLGLSPVFFAGTGLLLTRNLLGVIIGFLLGLAAPNLMINFSKRQRIKKFQGQLVDCLMILSSSLKAGLSFVQAIEVLCEEMPPPAAEEFKLILKENKWGIPLEESLEKLRKRIPIEEVNLIVTSILIARESGGEFPRVLSRLTETIRDNAKLKEKISTLTLQGRLQGYIMMGLPFVFTFFVYRQNPEHFDVMLQTSMGKMMIIVAVALQLVGMFLIYRISKTKF
jgi:tight adherence protein B